LNHNYYIPAQPAYQNIIQAIWQVSHSPLFSTEYIIPKGVIEVIFNFSDSNAIPAQIGDKVYHLPNCFINGFNTVPIQIHLPEKQVFFGIIFQPLAVKKIFRVPGSELADITIDLTLIDPAFGSLWHQLAEQTSFDARVSILLHWLKRYITDHRPQDQLMNKFLYAPKQHTLSANGLADSLCYSTRHLSRKLFEVTGMNAEEILLYKKYLHAVELMHQTTLSLTEIAHQSFFTDQSHFIKTFKAYAGITPGAYRRKMSWVKGHIYDNVR
jgi:AraC-like DNA-binding protein